MDLLEHPERGGRKIFQKYNSAVRIEAWPTNQGEYVGIYVDLLNKVWALGSRFVQKLDEIIRIKQDR